MNSAGYAIQTETDVTNDGSIDKVSTYTLNEKGNILQKLDYYRSYDAQGVATDTLTQKEVYSVDSNGYTVGMTRYMGSSTQPILIESYEFNALGQQTKALIDNYGDGKIDLAKSYTLDVYGNIVRTDIDVDNDGSVDSIITYERDVLGQSVRQSTDSDADDKVDSTTTYIYDTYGRFIRYETDTDMDGSSNIIQTRTYNALGQMVSRSVDSTANGLTSDDRTYLYSYDEYGNQTGVITVRTATGRVLRSAKSTFNSDGLVERTTTDEGNDGTIDTVTTYEYDKTWKVAIKQTNYTGDESSIESIVTKDLGSTGKVIRIYTDLLGDGTINSLDYGSTTTNSTVGANLNDDFTALSTTDLAKLKGLSEITLSSSAYKTEITLDSATIAKIAPTGTVAGKTSSLIINGDATDTVNLEGGDFTKLTTTHTTGTNTFDMYNTTVNDTTYTLFIDNDVNTILG